MITNPRRRREFKLFMFLLILIWFNFVFEFSVVTGPSMQPTYSGEHNVVFVIRAPHGRVFMKDGSIVTAIDPEGYKVIKRVKWCKNDRVFLEGDNKDNSCDSREYGPISRANVTGLILFNVL